MSRDFPGKPPIDCLLWRDDDGILRGIVNHYPVDYPPYEKAGNVNIWVDPTCRRTGIASQLWAEAVKRWNVRFQEQRFTQDGVAFARAVRRGSTT
jgi:GNAT superfamily N-acetyltransferase